MVDAARTGQAPDEPGSEGAWSLFAAQSEYAEAIVMSAMGDADAAVASLDRALEFDPTYAPAIMSRGLVDYQLGRPADGWRLLVRLLELPDGVEDLARVIDAAGEYLIDEHRYAEGLALYEPAAARFPDIVALHAGVSCCAGHLGRHDLAVAASRAALELAPDSQLAVNDLGWSLFEAGQLERAIEQLERAVALDPDDPLAAENLRFCRASAAVARDESVGTV